jgi:hypothetical protein
MYDVVVWVKQKEGGVSGPWQSLMQKVYGLSQKKSQPENRPAPINPITMKTGAKLRTIRLIANIFSILYKSHLVGRKKPA